MGIYREKFKQQHLMLSIFHGEVIEHELHAHLAELRKYGGDAPGTVGLSVICSNASASDLSHRAILEAGKQMRPAEDGQCGRLAIVAKNSVGLGLARAYQIVAEIAGRDGIRVMDGDGLHDAMQWLGVDQLIQEVELKIEQMESFSSARVTASPGR